MVEFITLEAAAQAIPDGAVVGIGGMTLYRRPVALARALIARQARRLTLVTLTAGYESDLLVGAGCVDAVRTCYFGLQEFGLAPMFTERAHRGELRIIEETELSLALGLRAAAAGIGFLPSRAWQGTDLLRVRPDVRTVTDPYTGETLTALPALPIDVAVIHAVEIDADGNARLNHNLALDQELITAAHTVIVTADRQVERMDKAADGPIMPGVAVNFAAIAPRGAAPTSCSPLYPLDGEALLAYVEACSAGAFEAYLAGEYTLRDR
jgi:glutaconate CoA-transferase subunit A